MYVLHAPNATAGKRMHPSVVTSRCAALTRPAAAGIILLLFYLALILGVRDKSATLDEPGHAIAGYTYWKFGDFRLDPENGNLPQRIIGLPLALGNFRFPDRATAAWRNGDIYTLADQWFYEIGNDFRAILWRGRAAVAVLAVGLGALVWWWSRELFGPAGGLLSLVVYVLNPAMLANGALMTSDMASAFFSCLSVYCVWAMMQKLSIARVGSSALAMGLLFVAKMSAVIIIPVAFVMAVVRVFDRRPLSTVGSLKLTRATQRAAGLSFAILVHIVVIAVVVWASYGFRFRAFANSEREAVESEWARLLEPENPLAVLARMKLPPAQVQQAMGVVQKHTQSMPQTAAAAAAAANEIRRTILNPGEAAVFEQLLEASKPSLALRMAAFAHRARLLPEAYIFGYVHVWKKTGARIAFLNGEARMNDGWFWFFPYTLLVKTPLALLALLVVAAVAIWRTRSAAGTPFGEPATRGLFPLLLFVTVYLAAAVVSKTNIGHRHILPIYPPLFVMCGAAAFWIPSRWTATATESVKSRRNLPAWLVAVLLGVLAVEAACWFPNYLAYFNGIVRPSQGYRHLIDSSLDWGQDLPALRRYIEERKPAPPLYLAQFGRGPRPDRYGIAAHPVWSGIARPLVFLEKVTWANDQALIEGYLRQHPEYDPRLVITIADGADARTVALRRSDELTLAAGTYFISATALQPISPRAFGPWSASHETTYQRLKADVAPLLSSDVKVRATALQNRSANELLARYEEFAEFRFARLTAFLRRREPDDLINYSILVYRLSDADIVRALEGPIPGVPAGRVAW